MRTSVIGAGSWGTAFATLVASSGQEVTLWGRNEDLISDIATSRENVLYLPGSAVPENVTLTSDIGRAARDKDLVVIAVPAQEARRTISLMAPHLSGREHFLSLCKGIEIDTFKRISEVIEEQLTAAAGDGAEAQMRVAVLSGPNHAEEVAKMIPSATVIASKNVELSAKLQAFISRDHFRVYTNEDIVGVELAGAIKNIIAVAAGISDGLGYGDNTKASLLTRGLAEMVRFGAAFECSKDTFYGLAGIGDLIATCTSKHSRNRNIGEAIGLGKTLAQAEEETVMVAEGTRTVIPVLEMGQKHGLDLPITRAVHAVLYDGLPAKESVIQLMRRGLTSEI